MSYMIRGNNVAETDPFDGTPFTQIDRAVNLSDELNETIVKDARKVYNEVQNTNIV